MEEYGSFGTTAIKLDIGPEYSSLGLGLAYLYRTFGYTVGKLVGQYSDSDRVSQSRGLRRESLRKLNITRGERENLAGEQWCGGSRGSASVSHSVKWA